MWKRLSRELNTFLKNYSRIVLVSHTDMDGMASIYYLKHYLKEKVIFITATDRGDRSIVPEEAKFIETLSPDLVIATDISIKAFDQWNKILAHSEGMIIDHHKPQDYDKLRNLKKRILSYELFKTHPDRYSASYILFKMLKYYIDIPEDFAVSGLMGDFNFRYFKNEFDLSERKLQLARHYGMVYKSLGGLRTKRGPSDEAGKRIRDILLEILLKSRNILELDKHFREEASLIELLNRILADREKLKKLVRNAIKRGNKRLVIVRFDSSTQFFLKGNTYLIEEMLKKEFPEFEGIVIIVQEGENLFEVSVVSRNKEIPASEIVNDIGGGHSNVGGGSLYKSYKHIEEWLKEKERIILP